MKVYVVNELMEGDERYYIESIWSTQEGAEERREELTSPPPQHVLVYIREYEVDE